jgi:hypothetical protein
MTRPPLEVAQQCSLKLNRRNREKTETQWTEDPLMTRRPIRYRKGSQQRHPLALFG